jgi:S-adenosylmethionine:tRNA ribosyltransferase-isomerase
MKISDYEYELPDERIADSPPKVRGTSRLIVVDRKTGAIADKNYSDVIEYLQAGDVLVLNDTKVIKARIKAVKQNGAERELVILEKHGKTDDWHTHMVMYRRKMVPGDKLSIGGATLEVLKILGDGLAIIKSDVDLLELTEKEGSVPLPPYMHRDATPLDIQRYQTVWAKDKGSVAAPTASLNMTDEYLTALRAKGVVVAYATLHVGLGTFMPIRADNVEDHTMHKEYFVVPKDTVAAIQSAKQSGYKVVALGTTITRTLEYCADDIMKQEPKELAGDADIFMYPGYEFKVIDVLLTNFHAPHSTVLMLAAAFAGWPHLKAAYEHAIDQRYNFLSYGDSMLII